MLPFPPYKPGFFSDISIIEIGRGNWKQRVFKALGNYRNPPKILDSILDLVQNQLNGKTVLVEPYISTDWADEYQAWYSRTFRDISRRSMRLHFFAGIGPKENFLREADLLNLPPECTESPNSPYLGYSVVRPFEPITVADTVLKSPYAMEESNSVRCTCRFDAHILGHQLHVTGMPFIQQDKAVSVCAEANLWMVAKYMHTRGEARRFRPSEMDRIATSNIGFGATRDGLYDYQMFNALRLMDIKPDLIAPENAEDAIRLIYAYVSSEIPVVVAIPGHVFTVIGYTYSKRQNGILRKRDSMAGYVDSFIVHDDARGPYRQLKVGSRASKKKLIIGGDPVGSCLIPMPSGRINLRESDVRNFLANWLDRLKLLTVADRRNRPAKIWTRNELSNLVTRMYLRRNDQFKRDIYPPRHDPRWNSDRLTWRAPDTVARYWRQILPLYVWVVEFSERLSLDNNGPYGRQLIGEMLLDSTAHADDLLNSLLVVHLRGRMIFRENPPGSKTVEGVVEDKREFQFIDQLDKAEYSPLYRHYL